MKSWSTTSTAACAAPRSARCPRAHELAARHDRGHGDDSRRRALSRLHAEYVDRHARPGYRIRVPGRLHSAEEGSSGVHFRRRVSRGDAGRAGVDRRARPLGVGCTRLFAIVFFWQFPHFFSIAWLYRDDYAAGQIRMLPVVQPDGKSTARRILVLLAALIPVSLTPTFLGMSGRAYLIGALLLDAALLYVGWRLITLRAPLSAPLQTARPAVTAGHRLISTPLVRSHDAEPDLVVE